MFTLSAENVNITSTLLKEWLFVKLYYYHCHKTDCHKMQVFKKTVGLCEITCWGVTSAVSVLLLRTPPSPSPTSSSSNACVSSMRLLPTLWSTTGSASSSESDSGTKSLRDNSSRPPGPADTNTHTQWASVGNDLWVEQCRMQRHSGAVTHGLQTAP